MKTIEYLAVEKYIGQRELPAHKQIPAENYIDWAQFGAREAQRWIDPNEELPAQGETFLVKLSEPRNYDGHGESIYQLNIRSSQFDKECLQHLNKQGVVGWRPIERN